MEAFYGLADDAVCRFLLDLRDLARARLAEVEQVVREYFGGWDELEPIGREQLLSRLERGEAVVVDLRPSSEYAAGHISGAISIPLEELGGRLDDLPRDAEIGAHCRGPYCVFAPQAPEILRENGLAARRLEDGFPEWRLAGLPVEAGVGR